MGESPLSNSLLATVLTAVTGQIGDQLPAAFGMQAGDLVLAADLDAHTMPVEAVAVRWPLGADEATLVVALTPDAADLLRTGPPEMSLTDALTALVQDSLDGLAPLLEGTVPALGTGEEVPADEALASGPGDAVSVPLDDAGTHRATVGMRLVVSDDLMQPATAESSDPAGDAEQSEGALPSEDAEPVASVETAQAQAPIGMDGSPAAGAEPIPVVGRGPTAPAAGIPLPSDASKRRAMRPPVDIHQAQAHPAEFASFDQLSALPSPAHSMAMLGEVEMGVTAELGRTRMTVRDVLAMNPGSIIELDRAAGSPVDVVVNGTLIARGEVVVIDEEFGVRITEIMGMAEEAEPFSLQVAQ